MEWDAQKYSATCGRVTEHGTKLVDILKNMHPKKVLDVGCGTGVLTNDISKFANDVIGIDSSSAMIAKAKELYPGINFIRKDACFLQWDGSNWHLPNKRIRVIARKK